MTLDMVNHHRPMVDYRKPWLPWWIIPMTIVMSTIVSLVNHTHAHGHYQPWLAMLNHEHQPWLTMMMLTMVDHVKP